MLSGTQLPPRHREGTDGLPVTLNVFHLEVIRSTSAHILTGNTSHMVKSHIKGVERCNPATFPGGELGMFAIMLCVTHYLNMKKYPLM